MYLNHVFHVFRKTFLFSAPLHYHITDPPPRTPLAAGNLSVGVRKRYACPRHRNHFHHCRHHCATPVPPPRSATIYSVAFFVTLRFSNLLPYVAILKMFHVKIRFTHVWTRTNHEHFMKIGSKLRPVS